jgi:hypothetical protein
MTANAAITARQQPAPMSNKTVKAISKRLRRRCTRWFIRGISPPRQVIAPPRFRERAMVEAREMQLYWHSGAVRLAHSSASSAEPSLSSSSTTDHGDSDW